MGFIELVKERNIKNSYNSAHDNILDDFFIPILEKSKHYYRMTGSFSSTVLSIAARGIHGLLENEGDMKLIIGAFVSQEDVDSIRKGIENYKQTTEKFAVSELRTLEDNIIKDHVSALGWLISKGKLEVRFAMPVDEFGIPTGGLFHAKCGIFEDADGRRISFDGSENESMSGWMRNTERFKAFFDWIDAYKDLVNDDVIDFTNLWEGTEPGVAIFSIPEAVKNELIRIAPSNEEQLSKLIERLKKSSTSFIKRRTLWKHQKEAIENWEKNNRVGIMEMATGTGKTWTAIEAISRTMKEKRALITVISCPYDHLVKQWLDNIKEYRLDADLVIADSSNSKWKKQLLEKTLEIRKDLLLSQSSKTSSKNLIVLTTHDSLSSPDLINPILETQVELMLVVDEVHGIGAPQRKQSLILQYSMRLGLSATPQRWFDEEGTKAIFDYFQKTVIEFSLYDAIHTINPDNNESYLTPYYYRPILIELTPNEIEDYIEMSESIEKKFFMSKKDSNLESNLENLYFKRQAILNNAINKFEVLEKILNENPELKFCIIYCAEQKSRSSSEKQIDTVQNILNKRNLKQHRFTGDEDITPSERFGGRSEREHLLQLLASGSYSALVAMKCLDEGVDVPPARIAILMSSTGNPRQFIQRRGRVLRRYQGKKYAIIYDLIVIPDIPSITTDPGYIKMQKKIILKELQRYKEFAKDSENYKECLDMMNTIEQRINLGISVLRES